MAGAGSLTAELRTQSVAAGESSSCPRHLRAGRQGGTVAERYQRGVANRSAKAAATWWHLLSEDAVSEAEAAASSGAMRSRSVRAVHVAVSSSGGTVAPW